MGKKRIITTEGDAVKTEEQPEVSVPKKSIKKQVMQQQAIETLKKELDELKKKINQYSTKLLSIMIIIIIIAR